MWSFHLSHQYNDANLGQLWITVVSQSSSSIDHHTDRITHWAAAAFRSVAMYIARHIVDCSIYYRWIREFTHFACFARSLVADFACISSLLVFCVQLFCNHFEASSICVLVIIVWAWFAYLCWSRKLKTKWRQHKTIFTATDHDDLLADDDRYYLVILLCTQLLCSLRGPAIALFTVDLLMVSWRTVMTKCSDELYMHMEILNSYLFKWLACGWAIIKARIVDDWPGRFLLIKFCVDRLQHSIAINQEIPII